MPGQGAKTQHAVGMAKDKTNDNNKTQRIEDVYVGLPCGWETWVPSLGGEDPLEKGKATHSSILASRIPWTVQPMGSQIVRHD